MARGLFIAAAGISMALSVGIWFLADDQLAGIFVGTWVPSILALWVGVRVVLLTCATTNLNRRK